MTIQLSGAVRDAQANQFESVVGASPRLQIFSDAKPADCAAANTGTLLCDIALPADWLNPAAEGNGTVTKNGTWSGAGHANAAGGTNAGHFRIKDSTGTVCHMQGTVTITGGGGDMTLDNISIASGQAVLVTNFSYMRSNA